MLFVHWLVCLKFCIRNKKSEYNLNSNLQEILCPSLKKWNCKRLMWYFRMPIHRCNNTTEHSPGVFYFGSDCDFYMRIIWKSLTAGRYFSVVDNQKCIVLISQSTAQRCPNQFWIHVTVSPAHWHKQTPNISLLSVMSSTLIRTYCK